MNDLLLYFSLVIIGGFIVFIIVGLIINFWDNNSPESKRISEEIKKLHQEIKKSKQDKKEYPIITWLLQNDLECFARKNNIPVSYGEIYFQKDDRKDACGLFYYTKFIDSSEFVYMRIFIRDDRVVYPGDSRDQVFILAHELGHFISITKYDDKSEQGADLEGYKLIDSLLSDYEKENEELQIYLDVYFRDRIKDYSHPKEVA